MERTSTFPVVIGTNDLATLFPDFVKDEWAYLKNAAMGIYPDRVGALYSEQKLWFYNAEADEYYTEYLPEVLKKSLVKEEEALGLISVKHIVVKAIACLYLSLLKRA